MPESDARSVEPHCTVCAETWTRDVLQQNQDDARHQVAGVVLTELQVRNTYTLPWPAISLIWRSATEHLRRVVKRELP